MRIFKWVLLNILLSPLGIILFVTSFLNTLIMRIMKIAYGAFGFEEEFNEAINFNGTQISEYYEDLKFE